MVDRFGELPEEVRHLLDVVEIKGLAKQAGLQQLDAGPKGAVITFRKNQFANPEGLVAFMQKSRGGVRMQPDHKLVFKADWDLPEARLAGVRGWCASSPRSPGRRRRQRRVGQAKRRPTVAGAAFRPITFAPTTRYPHRSRPAAGSTGT